MFSRPRFRQWKHLQGSYLLVVRFVGKVSCVCASEVQAANQYDQILIHNKSWFLMKTPFQAMLEDLRAFKA